MRTALVTGASRGIGREIARRLHRDGFRVVLNYRSSTEEAESLLHELNRAGGEGNAVIFQADVSNREQVENMFRMCGPVDVLVNNAGIAQQKLFTDLTEQDWGRMLDVNISGVFRCCQCALPDMIRKKQGCIINISSMWGQVGASCEVHYSAAKAAVIGLTKALAKEVGPSGIRVNCVAPGVIQTEMNACLDEETIRNLQEETPLGEIGTPQQVASAVSFLASPEAGFITGQVLGVNGGFII